MERLLLCSVYIMQLLCEQINGFEGPGMTIREGSGTTSKAEDFFAGLNILLINRTSTSNELKGKLRTV